MFPLLGFVIGSSTYKQLTDHPGSTAGNSGQSRYVTIEKHNFWVNEQSIFTHMYIARGIYPIPPYAINSFLLLILIAKLGNGRLLESRGTDRGSLTKNFLSNGTEISKS